MKPHSGARFTIPLFAVSLQPVWSSMITISSSPQPPGSLFLRQLVELSTKQASKAKLVTSSFPCCLCPPVPADRQVVRLDQENLLLQSKATPLV